MLATSEILRALVGIESVSSLSNGPLLDAIQSLLEPHGWFIQRFPYIAADGVEKANLLAVPSQFKDSLPDVELFFVCHTDTVPFRSEWTDATVLTEKGGFLHGNGSCDVKGSLAALISAALQVDTTSIKRPVAFAFTAEEEIGCIGATKLAASGAIRPRYVIVCEPTSLRPATAGKGYALAEVNVRGREAHSAFPYRGASAINAAAGLIVRLEQMQRQANEQGDDRFTPPVTTFNVGVLKGGTAKNIVAGACSFLVEWRPLPSEDPQLGGSILNDLARATSFDHPNCEIEINVLRADSGFSNPAGDLLGAKLCSLLNRAETGISFGSEATRFASLAEETVVVGPGDMETAHSERERVPIDELEEWTNIIKHLLLNGLS
ncbi:acetylornithine deacetylase [Granulicella aggregans]|uniref:Acetylornithine deacetylase n=1 Tax=Granulicella aggregans TaxID=474949 RepID=A0A7W7ZBI8_9BACT|nr:acetylornithine deacetylase [Granulicella aggregans]